MHVVITNSVRDKQEGKAQKIDHVNNERKAATSTNNS